MRIVTGRKITEINAETFADYQKKYPHITIDLGTGDGRFVYRSAKEEPNTLWIGIDPAVQGLRESSHKASRKPKRGGTPNALFVAASIERLPEELFGCADRIFVNYPWGSLLAAFVAPYPEELYHLSRLAKPEASIQILLNHSVFEDSEYMERLGLPSFSKKDVETRLSPELAKVGIIVQETKLFSGSPHAHTSWGRRLIAGSKRKTLSILAQTHNT